MAGSERNAVPFLSRRHIKRIDAAELTHAVAASVRRTIERCAIIDYAIPDGLRRPGDRRERVQRRFHAGGRIHGENRRIT